MVYCLHNKIAEFTEKIKVTYADQEGYPFLEQTWSQPYIVSLYSLLKITFASLISNC